MKTLLTTVLLALVLATEAQACAEKMFCPTLIKQAYTMFTRQTDDDLEGIVIVPAGIPKNEWRIYMQLIEKGRYFLEMYQDPSQAVEILGDLCPLVHKYRRVPKHNE